MQETIFDALRRGDTAAALDAARAHASASPRDAEAQRMLALALRSAGDLAGAREAIEHAIALAPEHAGLHLEHAGLLLGARDVEGTGQALRAAVALDPNQFAAYVLQAQLAMGRNDLDEAERLARLAGRVSADDPALQGLMGTLALRRGRVDEALALLATAFKRAPGDAVVLHALGIAHMTKGHLAFAEQAFRRLLELAPGAGMVRLLIAQLQLRQGRPVDAAAEITALVADPATATPELQRYAGELQLAAGRPDLALPLLRAALAADPRDRRTLVAIMAAWARVGDTDDARRTLDAALATSPDSDELWRARMMLDWQDAPAAGAVSARWRAAMPDSLDAVDADMALHIREGRSAEAEAAARLLLERDPGHLRAGLQLAHALVDRAPSEAVQQLEAMIARDITPADRALFSQRLGVARHRAGDHGAAVRGWEEENALQARARAPLPAASSPPAQWPEPAAVAPDAPRIVFLAGLPGSPVERVADLLAGAVPAFRSDRFGPRPPADLFQNVTAAGRIASGALAPAEVIDTWRAALPARGVDGAVIDWLVWWDNAYAAAMRDALPGAMLLAVLRDPRDMLLNWLAFGSSMPFALESAQAGAEWMAAALGQLADLHEQDLVPHRLLRLDDSSEDAAAMAAQLGDALDISLPEPPAGFFGAPRFAAGTWRTYAELLAGPFATLAPVARRLGYPDA